MNKPIFEMTGNDKLDTLLTKINDGADINIQDHGGNTALMIACRYEKIEYVKLLLENGADVNIQDNVGNTALIDASYYSYTDIANIDIAKLLIEKGANIDIKTEYGYTALMQASDEGKMDVCKLLIETGADVNITRQNGRTAVDLMKYKGIYWELKPIIDRMEGLKYFKEVFVEHAETYMDIFNTTLYNIDLDIEDIKANIDMFYSTIVSRMENNAINENVEL